MAESKREQVIIQLLERWDELVEPGAKLGIAGDGDSPPRMPRTYTPTVRELERLLHRMRDERRSQWWHVTERYMRCRQSLKDVPVKRKGKNGKTALVMERQLVTAYSASVRLEKVRRGIQWLADEWALPHEPFVPDELLVSAA